MEGGDRGGHELVEAGRCRHHGPLGGAHGGLPACVRGSGCRRDLDISRSHRVRGRGDRRARRPRRAGRSPRALRAGGAREGAIDVAWPVERLRYDAGRAVDRVVVGGALRAGDEVPGRAGFARSGWHGVAGHAALAAGPDRDRWALVRDREGRRRGEQTIPTTRERSTRCEPTCSPSCSSRVS